MTLKTLNTIGLQYIQRSENQNYSHNQNPPISTALNTSLQSKQAKKYKIQILHHTTLMIPYNPTSDLKLIKDFEKNHLP
jgi:hypothetical protein